MRKFLSFFVLSAGLVFAEEKIVLKKPPSSLDKYYPPASTKFEFLSNMHAMSTAFYGINANINEGNWEKALMWAQKLKEIYVKTSKMVPEWKNYFKPELADALVNAVKSKDTDKVIKASRNLGQTCAKCHRDNELVVKLYYHFPSFDKVKLEDPIDFMEYETGKYMKVMTNSLKALKVFLSQGDLDRAQEEGMNFIERARGLRAMCSKCHTNKLSEEVILGKNFEEGLAKLEKLLSETPKKEEVFQALGQVTISCAKCHNVHLAPAMVREAFSR